MRKLLTISLLILLVTMAGGLSAAQVDTLNIPSASMKREIKNVVILPQQYNKHAETKFPVLYLLHGFGGDHHDWVDKIKPNLPKIASQYGMIIVCPDGQNSWYWDSPVDSSMRFETFITQELIAYIDTHFNTIQDRSARAITGLSMGGHGGLFLGIRHSDMYGACGSMSGGVDIRSFPNNWKMVQRLGHYHENPTRWDEHTVMTQLYRVVNPTQWHATQEGPQPLAIIIDCGTEDFFYEVNMSLHREMLHRNIPHTFITRPGGHNSSYWREAIDFQTLFFGNFFAQEREQKSTKK